MRNNKAILDEAARSVRRTFIGSLAGSVGMLAVVGAAGAYGMPEKFTAHAFAMALSSLKLAPHDRAASSSEQALKVAEIVPQRDVTPVPQAVPEAELATASATVMLPKAPVVRSMPEPPVAAAAKRMPVLPEPPAAAPLQSVVATAPPIAASQPEAAPSTTASVVAPSIASQAVKVEAPAVVAPAAESAPSLVAVPKVAEAAPNIVVPKAAEPAPKAAEPAPKAVEPKPAPLPVAAPARMMMASADPQALPEDARAPLSVPAPLVFAAPKPDSIPPLAELPKFESAAAEPAATVAAEPAKAPATMAATTPAAPEPVKTAAVAATAVPAMAPEMAALELPKLMRLPLPKPPLSPAQRLELHGKDYDKAEKCLAQAVYFEARDQALRGQQAVAQVVLNRVFSPYYPKDVCSVVFQNAHRHLSCQFTFACDGKPETIRERGAWARATRIAKQTLDAKIWLPEVNKATHYHATYVHPRWIRDMKVMTRAGIHIFYRPRNWGDGANEAHWGTAANTLKPVAATPAKPAAATPTKPRTAAAAPAATAAKHRAPLKRVAMRRT